mmetsp:Transcript_70146/g.195148  ORF Transcript_70146/g.195148 Transcript_70146/m.195148 type:complete len:245 (+) Transcript_70146:281-1015(+)
MRRSLLPTAGNCGLVLVAMCRRLGRGLHQVCPWQQQPDCLRVPPQQQLQRRRLSVRQATRPNRRRRQQWRRCRSMAAQPLRPRGLCRNVGWKMRSARLSRGSEDNRTPPRQNVRAPRRQGPVGQPPTPLLALASSRGGHPALPPPPPRQPIRPPCHAPPLSPCGHRPPRPPPRQPRQPQQPTLSRPGLGLPSLSRPLRRRSPQEGSRWRAAEQPAAEFVLEAAWVSGCGRPSRSSLTSSAQWRS